MCLHTGHMYHILSSHLESSQLLLTFFPLAFHLIPVIFHAPGQHRRQLLAQLVHRQLRQHLQRERVRARKKGIAR
jgi:hypothetical protein